MTESGKNLILGRLGRTRETHAGSPTVLVERTMDDAASRTGIVPDHHPEEDHPESHESVSHHVTGRLGLRPAQQQEAQQDEAHLPRQERSRSSTSQEKPDLQRPSLAALAAEDRLDPEADVMLPKPSRAYSDQARKQTHRKLTNALKELDLFHPDEHKEVHAEEDSHAENHVEQASRKDLVAQEAARELKHMAETQVPRKRRRRRKKKACHHKSTFRLCSRTLRCLKAYSRITGRWQYNLVGEALESYLELAITALDPESLKNMREILHELHHKKGHRHPKPEQKDPQ